MRSARDGSGTAARRASCGWSTGSARSTTPSPRRRGAPISAPRMPRPGLSREGTGLSRPADPRPRHGRTDTPDARDAFSRLADATRGGDGAGRLRHADDAARLGDPGPLPAMPDGGTGAEDTRPGRRTPCSPGCWLRSGGGEGPARHRGRRGGDSLRSTPPM
jgi:hypothetical protein